MLTLEPQWQKTNMRVPLSMKKHVTLIIWKLITPNCFRSATRQFGIGRLVTGAVVMEMCDAMRRVLRLHIIKLGHVQDVIDSFAWTRLTNCTRVTLMVTHAYSVSYTPDQKLQQKRVFFPCCCRPA